LAGYWCSNMEVAHPARLVLDLVSLDVTVFDSVVLVVGEVRYTAVWLLVQT